MNQDHRRRKSDQLWDFLSLLALAGTLIIGAIFLVINGNPYSPLNPFPPLALPAVIKLPTATSQPTAQATETATPTTISAVSVETDAALIMATSTPAWQTTPTLPAGSANDIVYDFNLREPAQGLQASQYDPNRSCSWMGVAGQVFDLQGTPVRGIRIVLQGVLDGQQIESISMSGTALIYGPAGFELYLGDKTTASTGQLTVQLVDQAGLPLSAKIPFDTYAECEKNLIWLDFAEIR